MPDLLAIQSTKMMTYRFTFPLRAKWFVKEVSKPHARFGVSLVMRNNLRAKYDVNAQDKKELFREMGYRLTTIEREAYSRNGKTNHRGEANVTSH